MAYRNFFHFLGKKWISREALDALIEKYPKSKYRSYIEYGDWDIKYLDECDGSEQNVRTIVIEYNDGTNARDPEPYIYPVSKPFELADLYDGGFNARSHFFIRSKNHELFPLTKNDSVETMKRYRKEIREKFRNFIHMTGLENPIFCTDGDEDMEIPVNIFAPEGRGNLLRFLATLDTDGIYTTVNVHFHHSTVDQLERLDTEMEFGDLNEVIDLAGIDD